MKRYYLLTLLLSFVVSCKHTGEALPASYPETAVGIFKDGIYIVQDSIALRREWRKALNKAGENYDLQNFKIEATTTSGDVKKQCFLLTATATAGKVKAAAVLLKKEDSFYFDENNPATVMCGSECANGCLPTAITNANGIIRLVCSSCTTCSKTDVLLIF